VTFELLVDAAQFWDRLLGDIAAAEERVWLQTLCFEPDGAGLPLAEALLATRARDRLVLMDAFCDHILSDRFIYAPQHALRRSVREEAAASKDMRARLKAGGVQVRVTNPAGFLWHRLVSRDHRKYVLIDNRIAYIGGINFTDHNFAWHDLMVRIESADVTRFLMQDFAATWEGKPAHSSAEFEGIEIHNVSGNGNEQRCQPILDSIASATRSITVLTPYLTWPFTDAMAVARRNGADVTIITPDDNNRKTHRRYVVWLAATHDFKLRYYHGRMSHLKAMLIDDEKLIVGSSNFDWPTYHNLAETMAIITDAELIAAFRARVLEPDLAASTPAESLEATFGGWYAGFQHRWWAYGARTIGKAREGKRIRVL
jgi:cardiolipin synthase A/B